MVSAFKQQLDALQPLSTAAAVQADDREEPRPRVNWPVAVIGTSSASSWGGGELNDCFLHRVTIDVPTEKFRLAMLQRLLGEWQPGAKMIQLGADVDLRHVAQQTAVSAAISSVQRYRKQNQLTSDSEGTIWLLTLNSIVLVNWFMLALDCVHFSVNY